VYFNPKIQITGQKSIVIEDVCLSGDRFTDRPKEAKDRKKRKMDVTIKEKKEYIFYYNPNKTSQETIDS